MEEPIPYLGEMLALGTAITWAFAVILFKRSGETVHPIALNTYKNILAGILLVPTVYLFGQSIFYPAPPEDYWLLLISGALGIGLADTFFFKSLNLLGAGLTAIVDCLYSPSIIFLAFIWLDESLSPMQIIGAVLIISAILTAATKKGRGTLDRKSFLLGLMYGALGMFTMAIGIVMIDDILKRSPLLWVTEIRIIGGLIILFIHIVLHRNRKAIVKSVMTKTGWHYTFWGSVLGTYLALIMWLGGMKYTQMSTAAVLNQTSNIFIFVFAALLLKERLTSLKVVGIILAVGGVFLVILGK